MKVHERYCWMKIPALLLMAGPLLAGPNWVTECGTELTEPGHYKLKGDLLDCPENGVLISGLAKPTDGFIRLKKQTPPISLLAASALATVG